MSGDSDNALIRRRNYLKASGSLVGAGIVAGCIGDDEDDDSTTVNLASAAAGSTGVLTEVATGEGLDQDNGINLELDLGAPDRVHTLVVGGAVDAGFLAPQGAAMARHEGEAEVSIFGPWLAHHNSVMTLPDEPYESWDDLRGERVGILPPPSGSWNHTKLLLAARDVDMEEEYDMRTGSPGSIHSLDAESDVAAHIHFPPVSVTAQLQDEFREVAFQPDLLEDEFGRNLHFVMLAAQQEWIDENPDLAQAVRRTIMDAQELVIDDPVAIYDEYREESGFETDEEIELAAEITPPIYPNEWDDGTRADVRDQLEQSRELGIIPEGAPVDVTADI